jgi:hypothetical protein
LNSARSFSVPRLDDTEQRLAYQVAGMLQAIGGKVTYSQTGPSIPPKTTDFLFSIVGGNALIAVTENPPSGFMGFQGQVRQQGVGFWAVSFSLAPGVATVPFPFTAGLTYEAQIGWANSILDNPQWSPSLTFVAPVQIPVNTVLPVITGTAQVGVTLSGSDGTWNSVPTSYTYRWLANGVAIGGATANTFLLTSAQLGAVITFEVTASNAGGNSAPATSAGTAAVSNPTHALATAWAARVVTNGGAAPSAPTVAAISTFCYALDSASLTSQFLALNVFAPDNLTACMTPLIFNFGHDPWANLNFVGGDLSVNGLKGDGASKYINTFVHSTNFVSSSNTGVTIYGSVVSNTGVDFGFSTNDATHRILFILSQGSTTTGQTPSGNVGGISVATLGAGYYSLNRVSTTDLRLFYAKAATPHAQQGATYVTPDTTTFVGSNDFLPFFGLWLFDSGIMYSADFSSNTLSFAAIHNGFSAAQSELLYAAVQALRTAFGGGFV